MAPHKKRKPPQQQHEPSEEIIARKNRWVILVAVIIFILFGAGIAFFAAGANVTWLVIGGAAGALLGYLFGHQIITGLEKKKTK